MLYQINTIPDLHRGVYGDMTPFRLLSSYRRLRDCGSNFETSVTIYQSRRCKIPGDLSN